MQQKLNEFLTRGTDIPGDRRLHGDGDDVDDGFCIAFNKITESSGPGELRLAHGAHAHSGSTANSLRCRINVNAEREFHFIYYFVLPHPFSLENN